MPSIALVTLWGSQHTETDACVLLLLLLLRTAGPMLLL